jgi:murein DD-endopeptidase MepM/ murein hydrolase activator NlpD
MRPPVTPQRRPARRVAATLLAGLLLVGVAPTSGIADELDDRRRAAQQRADAAQQREEQLQTSVEGLSAELAQAVAALAATEARLPAAQAELQAAQDELAGAERRALLIQARLTDATEQQTDLGVELAGTAARDVELRDSIGQLARQAYQGGADASALAVALDAQDLDDFNSRMQATTTAQRTQTRMLDELTALASDARNAEARLTAVTERIADLKAEADAEVARADAARQQAAAREQEIQQLIGAQRSTQQRLSGMKAQAEAEEAQAERDRAAIESELAGIIAEQQRAAAQAAQPSAPRTPAGPGSPPRSSGGGSGATFANPTSIVPMYVTSNYGMRLHPILGYTRLHAGIDLRTYCNNPVYAPRDATVQWAQWRNGFGNQVMLDYGVVDGRSLMSSSNHLTRSVVSAGQSVTRGQLIGYSGNTGLSGACHLHFEVYANGSTVDPAPLLGR